MCHQNNIHEEYHKDGKDEVHLLALSMYEKVVEHLLINKGKIEGYVMQEVTYYHYLRYV